LIFSKDFGLCEISEHKEFEFKCVNVTLSKTGKCLKLLQNVLLRKAYFDSLPITKRKYDNLQCLINNEILPHCHSSFYSGLKLV